MLKIKIKMLAKVIKNKRQVNLMLNSLNIVKYNRNLKKGVFTGFKDKIAELYRKTINFNF